MGRSLAHRTQCIVVNKISCTYISGITQYHKKLLKYVFALIHLLMICAIAEMTIEIPYVHQVLDCVLNFTDENK